MTHWWAAQLTPHAPGLWLILSLLTTITLSVLFGRARPAWAQWAWIGHWLLIPYFGLLFGGLSPRLMGLVNFDWSVSLSLGAGLIFIVLALLVVVRATVDLPSPHQGLTEESAPLNRTGTERLQDSHRSSWQTVIGIVAISGVEQFHWTFLRGGLWELILSLPAPPALPAYWAVWLAALVVLMEAALHRPTFLQWLPLLTILVTTSILFFYTRNFWLCWILHSSAALILASYSQEQRLPSGSGGILHR